MRCFRVYHISIILGAGEIILLAFDQWEGPKLWNLLFQGDFFRTKKYTVFFPGANIIE